MLWARVDGGVTLNTGKTPTHRLDSNVPSITKVDLFLQWTLKWDQSMTKPRVNMINSHGQFVHELRNNPLYKDRFCARFSRGGAQDVQVMQSQDSWSVPSTVKAPDSYVASWCSTATAAPTRRAVPTRTRPRRSVIYDRRSDRVRCIDPHF